MAAHLACLDARRARPLARSPARPFASHYAARSGMTSLNLSANCIEELPERHFQTLHALTSLDVSANQLKHIGAETLAHLPALR